MRRIRIFGLVDIASVTDPAEVSELAENTALDRQYANRSVLFNGLILRRICSTLQWNGRRFPTVSPREDAQRSAAQQALSARLTGLAQSIGEGPVELEPLARWVRGEGSEDACGPLVQQIVGRLFNPAFQATTDTWNAALLLNRAPRCMNPFLLIWWALTHKVDRAKQLLSECMNGDLAGLHAIGIALHNIVNGLNSMRELYRDPLKRQGQNAALIPSQCIFAPDSVVRQPVCPMRAAGTALAAGTIVLLKLQEAHSAERSNAIAFLSDSWSECPASHWVPALLEGTWRRAVLQVEQARTMV